jgi:predicted dinucleotide-binding enzyme
MSTAIIGVGNIGKAVATHLVAGGEDVIVAASTQANAEKLADELGGSASAATVTDAVERADTVILAVWHDPMKELVQQLGSALDGKIVVDPSNPIAASEDGQYARTLPDDVSAASIIADLLHPGAHLVKAFGTLGADALASNANRSPDRAVLFYASDGETADRVVERLISTAGFDPVKVGGLDQATRLEMFGDLHQYGALNGEVLNAERARAAVKRAPA